VWFSDGQISVHFKSALSVLISGFGSLGMVPVRLGIELRKKIFEFFIANEGKAARSIILVYECTVKVYGGKTVEIKTFLAQMLLTIVGAYLQPACPSKRYGPYEKETSVQKWKPRLEHGSLCIRPPPLREAA